MSRRPEICLLDNNDNVARATTELLVHVMNKKISLFFAHTHTTSQSVGNPFFEIRRSLGWFALPVK